MRGTNDNGYRYIKEAEARGAAAIVADSPIHTGIPVILCCNPRRKMAELAKRIYNAPDENMTLVGVTGTNGKTTVTHLIRDVLVDSGKKTALIGTNGCYYNRHLTDESFTTSTTPESAELWKILSGMYELGSRYAVCEVSSHSLVLDRVYGADFDIGVFTNLTQEHLDFHTNMENYFKAKEMLFDMSKFCIINTDDEYGKRLYQKFSNKSMSVGIANADIAAENISYKSSGTDFMINGFGKKYDARINIPGRFSIYNALCAYAVCKKLGVSDDVIIKSLGETKGVRGRAEQVETGTDYSVIIDYAHTPDGLQNIITALRDITEGRIITLFGCGGDRDSSKRAVMGRISGELSDFTVITSDNQRTEDPLKIIDDVKSGIDEVTDNYTIVPDRYKAIEYALKKAKTNDTVLLAGKGHEDYIIKGKNKIHFDEREIIKKILEKNRC